MNFSEERKRKVACAECRRLKARCDKRVPCSTCTKRGCDMLCPNSTMPPREGSRSVGIAREFLCRKIMKMEKRMHLLEDAKRPSREVRRTPEVDQQHIIDDEFKKYGLDSTLGSLYLSGENSPSSSGISGSSDLSLLTQAKAIVTEASSTANHSKEIDFSYLPQEIYVLHQTFPFTPHESPTELVQDMMEAHLPPLSRATALCETFWKSMSWVLNVVSRRYILSELIPMVYRHAGRQAPTQSRSYGPHDIALLFIVLAIGSALDPLFPPHNAEGQHYHILSRAALCLQPIFVQRSVATIKALNLMSVYGGICGIESKLEYSSRLLSLAAQVALQIGFHRDPSIWRITGREAYEQRTYFWNLMNGTLWQSLISGQPPAIIPSLIDCRIPTQEEEDEYRSGEAPSGIGIWSLSFITECLVPVVEVTQSVRPPSYDTILALDCKIREFSVSHASNTQDMVRSQLREATLLFLHRGFFAQALADFPWDPLRSPLRQSLLAAYQSATAILGAFRNQFAHQPTLCARVWRLWSFASLAAIIISSVAIRPLLVCLEPEPLEQLDLACMLFREAAGSCVRAQSVLPILLRLRQEATENRLKTFQQESRKDGSPLEGNYGTCGGQGTSTGLSRLPTHCSASDTPCPGASSASSNKDVQALPVPVVHQPLARITEFDEDACVRTVQASVPHESWRLHHEISSSTNPEMYGLPRVPYASHPPVHGVALGDQWACFTWSHRTGTHAHSHPSS